MSSEAENDSTVPEIIAMATEGNYDELNKLILRLDTEELNVRNHFGWTPLRQAVVGKYNVKV